MLGVNYDNETMLVVEMRSHTNTGGSQAKEGARSTMVMSASGYALSRQKAKALPAIPEPEVKTFGFDMGNVDRGEKAKVLLLQPAKLPARSATSYMFSCESHYEMRECEQHHQIVS